MYLIVGLGNPGKEYVGTRHNVGFDAIDYLAHKNDVKLNKLKFNAVYGEYSVNGEKTILFKPVTYMNLSGRAVAEIAKFYKIEPEKIIVLYDDVDINFSALRIRPYGSSGTHNGMKSIIFSLNSDKFPRIRIGIGKSKNPHLSLADYVLQKFDDGERDAINKTIIEGALASEEIIKSGVNIAMSKFNKTI